MTDKTTPAGWVVQATIPAEPEVRAPDAPWRHSAFLVSAASFKYFNVAIAAPDKAMEATTKYLAKDAGAKVAQLSVVRKLSSGEMATLSLNVGEVKPA
jgi:hypothetical protein